MLNEGNKELCHALLAKYGVNSQYLMTVEECSELQKAICKLFRGDVTENLHEELIDVIVMCQQLLLVEKISMDIVNQRATEKMKRALTR